MATKDRSGDIALPALGFLGTLRWVWTQLTSMRTALFLLLLLAVTFTLLPLAYANFDISFEGAFDNKTRPTVSSMPNFLAPNFSCNASPLRD